MFDNYLRERKETVFLALTNGLRLHHAPPILFTILSFLTGVICAILAWQGALIWGMVFWWLNRIFDGFDGTVARLRNLQTDFGGYADIIADFCSYAIIPIGLALGSPSTAVWLSLTAMLAIFYINAASWMYLSAILEKRQAVQAGFTSVNMPNGLIGGTETIIIYSAFFLLNNWLPYLFASMAFLVALTIIQRLVWAKQNL